MREIKFRGLSKNGWEYGLPYFAHGTGEWKITRGNGWQPSYSNPDEGESTEWINVDANTICQFTGLKDIDGKEIYEGDVVSMHQFLFDGNEVEKIISGVIGWDEYGLTLEQVRNEFVEEYTGYDAGEGELPLNSFYGLHEESWTLLGNKFENPELLK